MGTLVSVVLPETSGSLESTYENVDLIDRLSMGFELIDKQVDGEWVGMFLKHAEL